MAKKYLDYDGLLYFWQKIKTLFVPTTRKVNNKALSADITLTASDVGAAPTSHKSTATTYGAGDSSNYGHLKLSDSTSSTTSTSGGTAATPKAVKDALDAAKAYVKGDTLVYMSVNTDGTVAVKNYDDDRDFNFLEGTTLKAKIDGIAAGAEVNVQADWNITDPSSDAYIKNKPTIPTVEDEIFIAEYGETSYADVASAYSAGKQIFMKKDEDGDYIFAPLTMSVTNKFVFVYIPPDESVSLHACQLSSSSGWQDGYVNLAQTDSPAFTGTPTAPTAASHTNNTQIATTAFVTTAVQTAVTGAIAYKGIAPTSFAPTNYTAGWYWIIGTAGTYVGQTCEAGDMIFCKTSASAYAAANFDVVQTNLDITSITNAEVDTIVAS